MRTHVYPVQKWEDTCEDYAVKVNGSPVQLHTARASCQPFNRRWPGHQRQKSQTELINFLSMEMDEPVTFEITPKESFEKVTIRPLSLGIQPEIENGTIRFTLEKPAFVTVEPYGRYRALHIFADPISAYGVNPDDENVIYFGAGEHDVGHIELQSNQTLFIDEGAVVYACVHAIDADNIKIIGRGILDNSRNKAQILFEANADGNATMVRNAIRKHTIVLEYCTGVEIDGITIRDSLLYNIRPWACTDIRIANVKVIGSWRYNSDGFDIHNCRNMLVENCFLRTFDDSICVKGFDYYNAENVEEAVYKASHRNGKCYDVCENIRVRNCNIWSDYSQPFPIGAETQAEEIRDIVFEDCDVIHLSCGCLDCHNIHYADVHDILYQNINVEYDDVIPYPMRQVNDDHVYEGADKHFTPWLISVRTYQHFEYSHGCDKVGISRDITFRNIRIFGKHPPKAMFRGHDAEHKSKDITIENLYWNGRPVTDWSEFELEWEEAFTENIRLIYTGK